MNVLHKHTEFKTIVKKKVLDECRLQVYTWFVLFWCFCFLFVCGFFVYFGWGFVNKY